jgi:hypothetical protein
MVVVAKSENLADLRLLKNIDSKHLVVSYGSCAPDDAPG